MVLSLGERLRLDLNEIVGEDEGLKGELRDETELIQRD